MMNESRNVEVCADYRRGFCFEATQVNVEHWNTIRHQYVTVTYLQLDGGNDDYGDN